MIPTYGRGLHLFPRRTMRVTAGPAVDLDDLYDRPLDTPTLKIATERIMVEITDLLEGIRGGTGAAIRHDPQAVRRAGHRELQEGQTMSTRAAVLGTGSWGTAFAATMADSGSSVVMWGRGRRWSTRSTPAATRPTCRESSCPTGVTATVDAAAALDGAEVVVLAVRPRPSAGHPRRGRPLPAGPSWSRS